MLQPREDTMKSATCLYKYGSCWWTFSWGNTQICLTFLKKKKNVIIHFGHFMIWWNNLIFTSLGWCKLGHMRWRSQDATNGGLWEQPHGDSLVPATSWSQHHTEGKLDSGQGVCSPWTSHAIHVTFAHLPTVSELLFVRIMLTEKYMCLERQEKLMVDIVFSAVLRMSKGSRVSI